MKVTVSDQIRELHDAGKEIKEIAKFLGIRYQFAYSVVSRYISSKEVKVRPTEIAATQIITPEPSPRYTPQPFASKAVKVVEPQAPIFKDVPELHMPAQTQSSKNSLLQRLLGK
jgi:hypothetical protein